MPVYQSEQDQRRDSAMAYFQREHPEFLEKHAAMSDMLREAREQLDRLRRGQRVPDVELRGLIWRIEDTVGR